MCSILRRKHLVCFHPKAESLCNDFLKIKFIEDIKLQERLLLKLELHVPLRPKCIVLLCNLYKYAKRPMLPLCSSAVNQID